MSDLLSSEVWVEYIKRKIKCVFNRYNRLLLIKFFFVFLLPLKLWGHCPNFSFIWGLFLRHSTSSYDWTRGTGLFLSAANISCYPALMFPTVVTHVHVFWCFSRWQGCFLASSFPFHVSLINSDTHRSSESPLCRALKILCFKTITC